LQIDYLLFDSFPFSSPLAYTTGIQMVTGQILYGTLFVRVSVSTSRENCPRRQCFRHTGPFNVLPSNLILPYPAGNTCTTFCYKCYAVAVTFVSQRYIP